MTAKEKLQVKNLSGSTSQAKLPPIKSLQQLIDELDGKISPLVLDWMNFPRLDYEVVTETKMVKTGMPSIYVSPSTLLEFAPVKQNVPHVSYDGLNTDSSFAQLLSDNLRSEPSVLFFGSEENGPSHAETQETEFTSNQSWL